VFLAVFVTLVVAGHLYIADRLLFDTSLPDPSRRLGGVLLLALAGSVLAQPFVRRVPGTVPRIQGRLAYFWFGASFLLVTCLLAAEIPSALAGWAGFLGDGLSDVRAFGALGFFALLIAYGSWRALGPAPVRRVEVQLAGWPKALDGFRIAQISDLHLSARRGASFARRLVKRTNAVGADLIAVTGDVVDGSVESLAPAAAPLGELRAPQGVYFVTGNHDHYSGAGPWCDHFASMGIEPLRNRRVSIRPSASNGTSESAVPRFWLAGVDDHHGDWAAGTSCDLGAAVKGWEREAPVVLLSHNPATFDEAAELGIDLQISGHTHGGQIWPFHAAVRAMTPYVAGLYRRGDSALYVSRGTGYWGPPLRVGAPSEITELVLRSAG